MKIIFTRHGESYANVIREISNTALKHPLTRTGRQQANELADRLGPHAITRIYSSPMLRAIETSVIVANRLNLDYEVAEALREIDHGILEGHSDEIAWQMMGEVSRAWKSHQDWERRIEGGESFTDVRQRFVPFVQGLIQQYGQSDEVILCVAHGGLYYMMLPLVLANVTDETFSRHELAHTVIIEAHLTPVGLTCVSWNGVLI
jgi:broad specificity phosphatase PhoE